MTKSVLKVSIVLSVLLVMMVFVTSPHVAFANHTAKGAIFWYNACKSIDFMIAEECGGLISNHDTYGQGLSLDGWRVAKCIAGGALVVYAGHPELLSMGPTVGCGSTASGNPSTNTLTPNNPLSGVLQGLFGK